MKTAVLACIVTLFAVGCDSEEPAPAMGKADRAESAEAEAFLAWSMDKHADMGSFSAECDWEANLGGQEAPATKRTILYVKPNKFKIVARASEFVQTSVSDGRQLLEYSDKPEMGAQKYPAGASIAEAK